MNVVPPHHAHTIHHYTDWKQWICIETALLFI